MKNKKPDKPITDKKEINVEPKNHKSSGDPVWAIFLISVGIILLLNNFELIPWSIWGNIWKFWPIFLILAGVRIIIGKNVISTILISIIGILLAGVIILYSVISISSVFENWLKDTSPSVHQRFDNFRNFSEGNTKKKTITVEKDPNLNIEKRKVNMEIGARAVEVKDTDEDYYLQMEANYIGNRKAPKVEETLKDGVLILDINAKEDSWGWNIASDPYMNVYIGSPNILTSLNIVLGAGKTDIAVEDLLLSEINLETGAGTLNLDISNSEVSKIEKFTTKVGAGTMNISLPKKENLGWKILYDIGLGEFNIDSEGYSGSGTYTSNNYSDAETQIEMSVESGVGTVNIDFEEGPSSI